MAKVHERDGSWHFYFKVDGKRIRKSTGIKIDNRNKMKSKKRAQLVADLTELDYHRRGGKIVIEVLFENLVNEYLKYQNTTKKPSTVKSETQIIEAQF